MKQHIRLDVLNEVRQRIAEQSRTDDTHAEIYGRVEAIIADLAQPALA